MRYRVVFAKRFQSDGNASDLNPTAEMDIYIPDGVVAEKEFVERFEPAAKHSQEVLDEDDAWLGLAAPEVWEYDVVDSRRQDFEDAMRNSETVMEFSIIDETSTDPDEATGVRLEDGDDRAPAAIDDSDDLSQSGSGARSYDDGPAGQPTVDASADGMGPSRPYLDTDEEGGIANDDSGGIDELSIRTADDASLGLTNTRDEPADDWAADTGPTAVPRRGAQAGKAS